MIRDEVRGPLTSDQLRNAAIKGLVKRSTKVRKGEDGDWFRAEQIDGLIPNEALDPPSLELTSPPPRAPVQTPPPRQPSRDEPAIGATFDAETPTVNVSPTKRIKRNRRRSSPVPVLLVAICGIGLLMSLLYWLSNR
jgi:hypothetical protein